MNLAPGTYPIALDQIVIGERHRECAEDVSELRESIRLLGLLEPVRVSTEGRLIYGRHRMKAAGELGWERITVTVGDLDDIRSELAEIDENLMHRPLSVLERSEHIVRRDELLRVLGKRAKAGDNQHTAGTDTMSAPQTAASIGHSIGVSERTIRRDTRIATRLSDDERDALRSTRVADSTRDLLALTQMEASERAAVIGQIADGARSVADALKRLSGEASGDAPAVRWDTDTAERQDTPSLMLRLDCDVPSTKTRMHGDREYPDENEPRTFPKARRFDGAMRSSLDGLDAALDQIKADVRHDPQVQAAWLNAPRSS